MNLEKLKEAEAAFLLRYPGGFENPEIIAIRTRKHNVDAMIAFAQAGFAQRNFKLPALVVQNIITVITRSSIISAFEKPKFRDFAQTLSLKDRKSLSDGLEAILYGNEQSGFETMLDLLKRGKLAKWSIITACQAYFHPDRDVLIKPNTVKGIIDYFELEQLHYKPTPTWVFYKTYRSTLHEMKSSVHPSLSPSNIAFAWFLLLSSHGNLF